MDTHMTRDGLTWTEILTFNFWKVEENNHGGLFLTPHYPPMKREPRSQFATVYSDGTIVYDFPEDVPQYVKDAINFYMFLKREKELAAEEESHHEKSTD